MKIRTGFVSNSSSSSFTLIVPIKDHNEALSKLSDETRLLMDKVMCGILSQKVGKESVVVITGHTEDDTCYIGEFDIAHEWDELFPGELWYENGDKFFGEYRELLSKNRIVYESDDR